MFDRILRKKPLPNPVIEDERQYSVSMSGEQLLSEKLRAATVLKIKRTFSVTDTIWTNHYLYAIHRFAELVQLLPASEVHHHSVSGGLLDHTLETVLAGVRISQGYILPPNADPEKISSSADRWRFGIFIALLTHDLGKVVTDIEVVYREKEKEFRKWFPWFGPVPIGAEYAFRFRNKIGNSSIAKSLHEKASSSLLSQLITREATEWLMDDMELISQMLCTINHSISGGLVVSEIVLKSDMASVSNNLGADTGINTSYSKAIPIHEKIIGGLRHLVTEGHLRRNKPGAALWVTETESWVVSKASMEAVQAHLKNEGHIGIPRNPVRLFEILREHDQLIKTPDGNSVWTAEIHDYSNDWRQKLTFLRIQNSLLWGDKHPEPFDGEITPEVNVKESPIVDSEELSSVNNPMIIDKNEKASNTSKLVNKPQTQNVIHVSASSEQLLSSAAAKELWTSSRKEKEEMLLRNEFVSWLVHSISRRKIRVNEPKAPVHVLDCHIALVSPSIFIKYLDSNPVKKKLYEGRAEGKKAYTHLQRQLEALDINQKSSEGRNIVDLIVEGERKTSSLKAYLLNKECFPSLSNFSVNPAIKLKL